MCAHAVIHRFELRPSACITPSFSPEEPMTAMQARPRLSATPLAGSARRCGGETCTIDA
jgi:hypothetical protein